jgi:hypothetical protein
VAARSPSGERIPGREVVLALLAVAACGGPSPDFQVRGAGVVVRSDAPFTRSPDFPARIESTLDAALRYWGGSWAELEGVIISFEGGLHVACDGHDAATGCFDGDIRVSTRDVAFTYSCVEQTALVHEVGHAAIGDPEHLDPRWMDFEALRDVLGGRAGYHEAGGAPCEIFVSVWRHPPAR